MTTNDAPWGRVEADGTVYVREGEGERVVGQYPDGTPEEALAYYERKFAELAGSVGLVEQRARRGAPAKDVAKTVANLKSSITGANAVGDLQSLLTRLEALTETVGQLTEQQTAEQQAAVEKARADREALVVEAEAIAAQDLSSVQWKQLGQKFDELFQRWQAQQQEGARLPKPEADALWKRFRAARSTVDAARKGFYADLDSVQREARQTKRELIEKAEALAPRGAEGITAYRALLDQWKAAGRAGRKYDDALWASFKAAGDVLFGAKAESDAADSAEFGANLEKKQALLAEAQAILALTDAPAAKAALAPIQAAWDAAGKVPREHVKPMEAGLRAIEAHVRKLEDEHWRKNNPETKARAQGLSSQLSSAIEKLETELAAAKAAKDTRKIKETEEALAARRIWLDAIGD